MTKHRLKTLAIAAVVASATATSAIAQGSDQAVGAVVRFTSAATSVDVIIGQDNPTVRDFLARLPLKIRVEEYAGREKIAYLKPRLEVEGSPGSDPEDGDLIYFVPWGNLGFYYDTSGIGYSDDTIHIGKYQADLSQLRQLEGDVTVEVVR